MDSTDVNQEVSWFYEQRARKAVDNLQKKNINAWYVPNREEALTTIIELVPRGATIARGDSLSIDQIGVIPELLKRGQNAVIDPFRWDADGHYMTGAAERQQMYREAFFADVFLTGTNALTLDGKLVNIDGLGNRVAAIVFGPKKVIVAASANKIAKDVDEALKRVREFVAPLNARRHYVKHHYTEFENLPCVRTGNCADCNHDLRICRYTMIIEGAMVEERGRINVVLVGEKLGL
jgi:hypothetical protein